MIVFATIKADTNWTIKKLKAEYISIPTPESVKILANVTAGFAKHVDDVKKVAASINSATHEGIFSGEDFSSIAITINRPDVAISSANNKVLGDLSISDTDKMSAPNIIWETITPKTPPEICINMYSRQSFKFKLPFMNIMKDIAGLKWAPETLINILIFEKSVAATAKAINKTVKKSLRND